MKKAFVFFAVIVALLAIAVPRSDAYLTNIYLSAFQNIMWQDKLTGEIYYDMGGENSYSYCVNPSVDMPVPGNYYAEQFSIAGNQNLLKVAWLMDNYGYSKFGAFPGFTAAETGTIVQLAIYDLIGQPVAPVAGYDALFTKMNQLINSIPATDLAYLSAEYKELAIYNNSDKGMAYQEVITPVPVPAAVWLLGSGLIGLAGLRKKVSKLIT